MSPQESDAAYAADLLAHAETLYAFADSVRELYHNSITDADAYYQ